LGIGLSKAALRRSALLVTTDSGPRHLATALRVPVVALFGPTFIAWTRTNHPHALNLQLPVPCGPCQRPVCPEGHHRCMRDLHPDEVFQASLRLLARDAIPATTTPGVRLDAGGAGASSTGREYQQAETS
jgi:heptosyltransferase-2